MPSKKLHRLTPTILAAAASLLVALACAGCDSTGDSASKKKSTKQEKELLAGGANSADIEQMRDFARLYWDKGEYVKATKQYERILEVKAKDPEATLGLGMCCAQVGAANPEYFLKGQELLREYNDTMAAKGDTRGLLGLGILEFKWGSYAASRIDAAMKQRTEIEDEIRSINERLATSDNKSERRRLERESKNWNEQLQKAQEGAGALEQERDDHLTSAVSQLTATVEENKLEVLAYKLRAEANSLRGPEHYAQAVEDLDVYLELTVTTGRERFQKMLESGESGESEPISEDAVIGTLNRLDRLEALLLEMRASLLRRMDQREEAMSDLLRVLDLFPERSSAYAELARTCEEMGNYAEAKSYYEQYCDALPPGSPGTIDAKTQARMRIQDLELKIKGDRADSRPPAGPSTTEENP